MKPFEGIPHCKKCKKELLSQVSIDEGICRWCSIRQKSTL